MFDQVSDSQEWLVTNNIGGYASGTVLGTLTRGYHGLLIAALKPPLQRTLLLTKLDETVFYQNAVYPLYTNRWADGTIDNWCCDNLERFYQEGTIPVWRFVLGDAHLEKRIWMQSGSNTTYIYYSLIEGKQPLKLSVKALVNYRDHHSRTHGGNWEMKIERVDSGICVTAFTDAVPFYILSDALPPITGDSPWHRGRGICSPTHIWYYRFQLARETERGLYDLDDNLCVATFDIILTPGESVTFVASTESQADSNGSAQLAIRREYEQKLIETFKNKYPGKENKFINKLVLAGDQFIVKRTIGENTEGKTIIAGYHWFSDWGRDTMIALPGLTLSTGRWEIARLIIRTFSQYVSQGMLPNRFPDDGAPLTDDDYNTIDATLWYIEAVRAYYDTTKDNELIEELFPILEEIIDWHRRGTRYNIHLDTEDGLLYGGVEGKQLTWMDAKIDSWVITPRIGKPVEINALWYNSLLTMSQFSQLLQRSSAQYEQMALATFSGFQRFWNPELGYCYDVLDTPSGHDGCLRPNQIFAVSLRQSPLTYEQQKGVVDSCQEHLLTPYGLRSLSPCDPNYHGYYGGTPQQRDRAYHQGTVWPWLLGPFVRAYLRVYQDPVTARKFLSPMIEHLEIAGMGTISEIFDGDRPFSPKGCIAQAWSVAEVLSSWCLCT